MSVFDKNWNYEWANLVNRRPIDRSPKLRIISRVAKKVTVKSLCALYDTTHYYTHALLSTCGLENMAKFKFCQNKYTLTKKSRRRKNLYFSWKYILYTHENKSKDKKSRFPDNRILLNRLFNKQRLFEKIEATHGSTLSAILKR